MFESFSLFVTRKHTKIQVLISQRHHHRFLKNLSDVNFKGNLRIYFEVSSWRLPFNIKIEIS